MRPSLELTAPNVEPVFSCPQIAKRLGYGISTPTLFREFSELPGVLKIPAPPSSKRRYTTIRVPLSVLNRWLQSRTVPATLPKGRKAAR
jgi:hypothetical protein